MRHPPSCAEPAVQHPTLNLPRVAPLPSTGMSLPAQLPSGASSLEDRFSLFSACSRDLDTLIGSSCLGSSELGNSNSKGPVGWFGFFCNLSAVASPEEAAGQDACRRSGTAG